MDSVFDQLLSRLKRLTAAQRRVVALRAGVSPQLPCKLVNGVRTNPRIQTIQPLLHYFRLVEEGREKIPGPIEARLLLAGEATNQPRIAGAR